MRTKAAIVGVALALPAGVASAASSETAAELDPKALVLKMADLPNEFASKSGRYVSNAQAGRKDKRLLANYLRWGRITGYEAIFRRRVTPSSFLKGPHEVFSIANVFRAARGAKLDFAESVGPGLRKRDPQGKLKRLPLGTSLGEQARLFTYVERLGGHTVRVYFAYWRAGRLTASVVTAGIEGGIGAESAVSLAKRQQLRIRRIARQ